MKAKDKVWVVHSGCVYEGGELNCLCESEKIARMKALEMVNRNNEQFKKWNEDEEDLFKTYTEIGENYWSNGIDYVSVRLEEVLKDKKTP